MVTRSRLRGILCGGETFFHKLPRMGVEWRSVGVDE